MTLVIPKRKRGQRRGSALDAEYRARVARPHPRNSTLDFAVGGRGWCYLLERHGLRKGDFKAAENFIAACRSTGDLPLDICAVDAARVAVGLEEVNITTVAEEVAAWVDHIRNHAHMSYTPISFWDDLDTYVEMAVEKLDLRNLFEPVCAEFRVPITNTKGWSDLHSRAAMMKRFQAHEEAGRHCVLLLCGDHDPGGLKITEMMRKNMHDLEGAVGWAPPDEMEFVRFGLNADFIDANGLTWIDNLETSSGMQLDDPGHGEHDKAYVRDYIRRFGVRKCEANALVVAADVGRQLSRDAILRYVPADAAERYERKLDRARMRLRQALRKWVGR